MVARSPSSVRLLGGIELQEGEVPVISSEDLVLFLQKGTDLLKVGRIADLPVTVPDVPEDIVKFLRLVVNFNDANVSTGVLVGQLPAGAQIVAAVVRVITLFNAGTTNVLTIGTNSPNYDNIFGAAGIAEGAAGANTVTTTTASLLQAAVATDVFAKYTQTGTAASQGQAIINIAYIAPAA